jgi:hypothetical protein
LPIARNVLVARLDQPIEHRAMARPTSVFAARATSDGSVARARTSSPSSPVAIAASSAALNPTHP